MTNSGTRRSNPRDPGSFCQEHVIQIQKKNISTSHRLPMGNGICETLALFHNWTKSKSSTEQSHYIRSYKRYIDDQQKIALEIFQRMNATDTRIQFEVEHPVQPGVPEKLSAEKTY